MRNGYSLPELLVVLVLATVLVPTGTGLLRRVRDGAAVTAVREETAALLVRARAEARWHGGATVVVLPEPLRLRLVVGGDTVFRSEPGPSLGVRRVTAGGQEGGDPPVVLIEFDALGIGRMASTTLRFRRGRAESSLVVSSLGRVTR